MKQVGTLGAELDRLETELRDLAADGHVLVRWIARRRLRHLQATRQRIATQRNAAVEEFFGSMRFADEAIPMTTTMLEDVTRDDGYYVYLDEALKEHGLDPESADFQEQYLTNRWVYNLSNVIRHQQHRIRTLEALNRRMSR